MNNIFIYSPKELTTDAFLEWHIKDLDKIHTKQELSSSFFYGLGLCKSPHDKIRDIYLSRQERNTDLIIRYLVNGKETRALFENKTYMSNARTSITQV